MNKKCGHKGNLMTVKCLLTCIAKYADEPTKCLKEAQQVIKSNFPMVQGCPVGTSAPRNLPCMCSWTVTGIS